MRILRQWRCNFEIEFEFEFIRRFVSMITKDRKTSIDFHTVQLSYTSFSSWDWTYSKYLTEKKWIQHIMSRIHPENQKYYIPLHVKPLFVIQYLVKLKSGTGSDIMLQCKNRIKMLHLQFKRHPYLIYCSNTFHHCGKMNIFIKIFRIYRLRRNEKLWPWRFLAAEECVCRDGLWNKSAQLVKKTCQRKKNYLSMMCVIHENEIEMRWCWLFTVCGCAQNISLQVEKGKTDLDALWKCL